MKNVQLKLAHTYESPLAAACAAMVQLKERGLTGAVRDAIKQDALEEIAAAWGELVEVHGEDSAEIAILRQTLNRVSKEVKGFPFTVKLVHQVYTVVKANERAKGASAKSMSKRLDATAKMAATQNDAVKMQLVRDFAASLGLEVRVSKKPAKNAA